MGICYLCKNELTEINLSIEHIIPNAIGGRLKSNKLLCRDCNNWAGQLIDANFAKFTTVLASKFNITREKGKTPDYVAKEWGTGRDIIVSPGNIVSFRRPQVTYGNPIMVVSNDQKTLLQEIERLKKEFPNSKWTIEDTYTKPPEEDEKVTIAFEAFINPELFLRSVCKTMVSFYVYKTNEIVNVERTIEYIRSNEENRYCWFFNLDFCKEYHNGNPYHLIILKGDKKQKAIYGYFEIFGKMGFISLLNGQYKGHDFLLNYTFDPVNKMEITFEYSNFHLSVTDIIRLIIEKPGLETWNDIQI